MEQASKSSHHNVINDPDVQRFLGRCALPRSASDVVLNEHLEQSPFIDPEDMAKLKRIERLKLTLPIRNIALKDQPTLTASVRVALYDFFAHVRDDTNMLETLRWFLFEEYLHPQDQYSLA